MHPKVKCQCRASSCLAALAAVEAVLALVHQSYSMATTLSTMLRLSLPHRPLAHTTALRVTYLQRHTADIVTACPEYRAGPRWVGDEQVATGEPLLQRGR